VTARRSSAEEVSVGVPAMMSRDGSKVLSSASPSSEIERLFLFEWEGPAERDDPRRVSLAFMLLPRNEASSNVPCGLGLLFFRNLLRSLSLWIGGEGGRRAKAEVGRRCVVDE
jgi:hypothetical protein